MADTVIDPTDDNMIAQISADVNATQPQRVWSDPKPPRRLTDRSVKPGCAPRIATPKLQRQHCGR